MEEKILQTIYNAIKQLDYKEKANILLFEDKIIIELEDREYQINLEEIKY